MDRVCTKLWILPLMFFAYIRTLYQRYWVKSQNVRNRSEWVKLQALYKLCTMMMNTWGGSKRDTRAPTDLPGVQIWPLTGAKPSLSLFFFLLLLLLPLRLPLVPFLSLLLPLLMFLLLRFLFILLLLFVPLSSLTSCIFLSSSSSSFHPFLQHSSISVFLFFSSFFFLFHLFISSALISILISTPSSLWRMHGRCTCYTWADLFQYSRRSDFRILWK